jgi:hypothetical protein
MNLLTKFNGSRLIILTFDCSKMLCEAADGFGLTGHIHDIPNVDNIIITASSKETTIR